MSHDIAIPARRALSVGPIDVARLRQAEALAVIQRAVAGGRPVRIAFCNANMLRLALSKPRFAEALRGFLLLNDGVGMDLCSRLFIGRPFRDNLNGTDFTPEVLRTSVADLRIFLLGGVPGTAEAAGAKLQALHPRHTVVGARDGYFGEGEVDAVVAAIARAKPDLLLVGMGNPRQEEFIAAAGARLDVPAIMAVGAFLDFTAGNVVRAPAAVRALRAEWLFRLAQEPRRLGRRYTLELVEFLWRILVLRLRAAAASGSARPTAAALLRNERFEA